MNKREQTVMSMLKPKVKAFGFNQKELKGVAAKIADNLNSEEDASDEDVNAEIETAIEAVLPFLEFGRSFANRVINDHKNENKKTNEDEDELEEEIDSKSSKSPKPKKETKEDEMPSWAKSFLEKSNTTIEALQREIAGLKGEKVTDARRSKLESLVKDTGTFGKSKLKDFSRMKFDDDEKFDEWYSEVEEDLKSLNQERANAGLAKLGSPAIGGSQGKKDDKKVLSDDDIKEIANIRS